MSEQIPPKPSSTGQLIIAIIHDSLVEIATDTLITNNFRVTRIASTGAFWKQGNTTMLIGVEATKIEEVIRLLKNVCTQSGRANTNQVTLFVINTTHHEQI